MEQVFFPAFGHKPAQLVGREQEISDFARALEAKPGDWHRITLVSGHKGMGKTALLLELAAWAEAVGYKVLQMAPDEDWSAMLMRMAAEGKVLAVVDGVTGPTSALRALTSAYRTASAHDCQVALVLAGSPKALEDMLNDSVLAFLKRSHRVRLSELSSGKVQAALEKGLARSGRTLQDDELDAAVKGIAGHPYLLQLVGSHLQDPSTSVEKALAYAQQDFTDDVLQPMLSQLSAKDMELLRAIAACRGSATNAALREKLGVTDNYLQPYRARLLRAGVITSPRRGELSLALPHLQYALQ